ncbi:MAG: C-GCAxxG-C-C family protein [Oscillospiraceae bacterium]|nr:C-GCAxxG-C-C family protein [Oscillospiraceae bacterium]
MSTREETAIELFSTGYNCAQSVFGAFCEDFGLDINIALKIACGFGGGGMRYKQTCGAVSGAIMAIGLKCGQYEKNDIETKKACYKKIYEFTDKFKNKNGSVKCCELLVGDKDIDIEMQNDPVKMKSLFSSVCVEFVKSAVQILENMEF